MTMEVRSLYLTWDDFSTVMIEIIAKKTCNRSFRCKFHVPLHMLTFSCFSRPSLIAEGIVLDGPSGIAVSVWEISSRSSHTHGSNIKSDIPPKLIAVVLKKKILTSHC